MALHGPPAGLFCRAEFVPNMNLGKEGLDAGGNQIHVVIDESATDEVYRFLTKRFENDLPKNSTPLNDLQVDSLELVETLFELEQHTGKIISNYELGCLITLGDLIQFFSEPAKK